MKEKEKRWPKYMAVGSLALILSLALAACGSGNEDAAASAGDSANGGEKQVYQIKTWDKTDCSSTPWVVGDALGFFADEGVEIIYTGDTQPAQQIPSILNGDNDVSSGTHPNTFAVAVAGGANLVAVSESGVEPSADLDPGLRHMWWFVSPDSEVQSIEDIKNYEGTLTFSTISSNICTDFLTNQILDKNGIPRDKIKWVNMPDVQAVQALKQGQVDVAAVHPPYYKAMEDAGALKIADTLDAGDLGPSAGVSYYVFNKSYVDKNPEAVQAFVRAITKAQIYANANPEEARKLTEEHIGVPVTAVHYYSETTKIDESYITPWLEDLENTGVIPKGKTTVSQLVTHDFEQDDL